MTDLRHDWTLAEIESIYTAPLPDLIYEAQGVHRRHHRPDQVQGCMLLSIKTGGCPEDCAYCPQSARYDTGVNRQELLTVEETLAAARAAREQGATRFCMGAAWRDVPRDARFTRVLDMVRGVRALGMEACCTLGMLTQQQAANWQPAGLTGVQPQSRHFARFLRRDHHHPRLSGAPGYACARASRRRSRCAAAASSAWAKTAPPAMGCCASSPRSIPIRKACR